MIGFELENLLYCLLYSCSLFKCCGFTSSLSTSLKISITNYVKFSIVYDEKTTSSKDDPSSYISKDILYFIIFTSFYIIFKFYYIFKLLLLVKFIFIYLFYS